ncbi:HAD family hydrolase [Candidatus Marinimicrobia bacterium]|nr:HAD family hydrolase [Candidatus Neomarinimicrobiota bacterium]
MIDITRIAMWSGPRNISTAMMRSFENRKDTVVIDEPFYAYYLNKTGFNHPCKKEVLRSQSKNWNEVVGLITSDLPKNKSIWYQKHMVHHILSFDDIGWVKGFKNCFLIRHPKEVIISYAKKNNINSAYDLGYEQQVNLFKKIKEITGSSPSVFDSKDILSSPKGILQKLCIELDIKFSVKMLNWPKGNRPSDGVWSSHWYKNVVNSDGFMSYKEPLQDLKKEHIDIFKECMYHYNYLNSFKI